MADRPAERSDNPQLTADPTGQLCSRPMRHEPTNLTIEFHHVIPVAWQLRTIVGDPPYPGVDPDGRGELWDARGIELCPTHHRNVHYWIVDLMHALAAVPATVGEAAAIGQVYNQLGASGHRMAEPPIALEALQRYHLYGSLRALIGADEWGQS